MEKILFKIAKRHVPNRKGGAMSHVYSLNVPADIAAKIPEGTLFEFTATEDGFVYRPVKAEKVFMIGWF